VLLKINYDGVMVETEGGFLACRHTNAVVMRVSHGGHCRYSFYNGWPVRNGYGEKGGTAWRRSGEEIAATTC